jgi:hypothetical protein
MKPRGNKSGTMFFGVNIGIHKRSLHLKIMCYNFKRSKTHFRKFIKKWFDPYRIHFCLLNNMVLLVTMDKFDPNLVFVNVNKLKPYLFLEDEIHGA